MTFSGIHVSRDFGAPSIRDIAVQSMRLVRFSGAAEIFWPIGMHCLLVADLMPKNLNRQPEAEPINPWLEVYALLHDAAEVVVADVPRPMKTAQARALEDRVQSRIHATLGVPEPGPAILAAVKEADFRAALAEGVLGCAGRGYEHTQTGFRHDREAEDALNVYLVEHGYSAEEALNADGRWALLYEARLRRALRVAQHCVSYAPDAGANPFPNTEETTAVLSGAIARAIEALYRSQEHRPSLEAVQEVVRRTLRAELVRK